MISVPKSSALLVTVFATCFFNGIHSAQAVPIASGTLIGFDTYNTASDSFSTYSIQGLLLPSNSTWMQTDSDVATGAVRNSTGAVVDNVGTGRFGDTWSTWGSLPISGETNIVNQDYIYDDNSIDASGHNARLDIFGLDDSLVYDLAFHAAILNGANQIIGSTVTIGALSQTIPTVLSDGAALWPNGGFAAGVTSVLFSSVHTNGAGQVTVFFDRTAGNSAVYLSGYELKANAVPEPTGLALFVIGALGLLCRRQIPSAKPTDCV